jgi:hypothetical protein
MSEQLFWMFYGFSALAAGAVYWPMIKKIQSNEWLRVWHWFMIAIAWPVLLVYLSIRALTIYIADNDVELDGGEPK